MQQLCTPALRTCLEASTNDAEFDACLDSAEMSTGCAMCLISAEDYCAGGSGVSGAPNCLAELDTVDCCFEMSSCSDDTCFARECGAQETAYIACIDRIGCTDTLQNYLQHIAGPCIAP